MRYLYGNTPVMLYTVKQVSERLGLTVRAVQIKCKTSGIHKKGNTYMIPERILKQWERNETEAKQTKRTNETNERSETDTTDTDPDQITETFSVQEYDKLQEVVQQYPNLLNQIQEYKTEIEYLRAELKERSTQMDKLIDTLQGSIKTLHQTNYIQAKDKGIE